MGRAMFEWDENKRLQTLLVRGLDFRDATTLFDGRPIVTLDARWQDEARFMTVGLMMDGKIHTVIWTQRENAVRIFTFRRSQNGEERAYHARHG